MDSSIAKDNVPVLESRVWPVNALAKVMHGDASHYIERVTDRLTDTGEPEPKLKRIVSRIDRLHAAREVIETRKQAIGRIKLR